MSDNNKSKPLPMLAKFSLSVLSVAACIALFIAYKAGAAPWNMAWFENGELSSAVISVIHNYYHQIIIVGFVGLSGMWFWMRPTDEGSVSSASIVCADKQSALTDEQRTEQASGTPAGAGKVNVVGDAADPLDATALKYGANSGSTAVKKSNKKFEAASAEIERLKSELNDVQEQLTFANESKAKLMSNISHELRTPLNGIIGMAELLSSASLVAPESRYVNSIATSADSLSRIVDDLLSFSRMESGNLLLENDSYDIRTCINTTCDALTPAAHAKNIELICYVDDEIPQFVMGDAYHLRQILNKLITNAISHTETGEVVVRITALAQGEDGKHLFQCDVQDTGIGMLPEVQVTLYEVFSQADAAPARRNGGIGMGLSMIQELVSMFGGTISFKSRVNEGTRFTFTIRQGVAAQTGDSIKRKNRKNAVQFAFENDAMLSFEPIDAHVLLAEDNLVNQDAARTMLAKMGCTVVVVGNGLQAVRQSEIEKFDMVFMNCNMPVMDGFEALKQIREGNTENKNTPIVALTANAMDGDREKCIDMGMSEYLSKPVRQKHLHGLLSAWVVNPLVSEVANAGTNANRQTRVDEKAALSDVATSTISEAPELNAEPGDKPKNNVQEPVSEAAAGHSNEAVAGTDAASGDEAAPIINMKAIDTIRSLQRPGKPDLLGKVAHLFLDKTPAAIVEMQAAFDQGDMASIKAHVHALKSSGAYLGADGLSETCRQIEAKAGDEDTEAVGELLENFVNEYDVVAQALAGIIKAA